MAYPGFTFALMLGVAIGTVIYYYFNQEGNQRQNSYQYDTNNTDDNVSGFNSWSDSRTSLEGSRRRRRRNSTGKCSICLDDISRGMVKVLTKCGHEFHDHCINIWLRQSRICPNCRCEV